MSLVLESAVEELGREFRSGRCYFPDGPAMASLCFSCFQKLGLANIKHVAVRGVAASSAQSGVEDVGTTKIEAHRPWPATGSHICGAVPHSMPGGQPPCANVDLDPSKMVVPTSLNSSQSNACPQQIDSLMDKVGWQEPHLLTPPMSPMSAAVEPSWRVREADGAANGGTCSFPLKPSIDSSARIALMVQLADGNQNEEDFQEGDLVLLGCGVPVEFRQQVAVVTKTAATHCTVIVLDKSERFGMGECWPMLTDLQLKSCSWRLGRHVVINGLQGPKAMRLNGCNGVICSHPREGHPVFVHNKVRPEQVRLVVCVYLDEPLPGADPLILLEPRFLVQQSP